MFATKFTLTAVTGRFAAMRRIVWTLRQKGGRAALAADVITNQKAWFVRVRACMAPARGDGSRRVAAKLADAAFAIALAVRVDGTAVWVARTLLQKFF